jgi:hypothetical protein
MRIKIEEKQHLKAQKENKKKVINELNNFATKKRQRSRERVENWEERKTIAKMKKEALENQKVLSLFNRSQKWDRFRVRRAEVLNEYARLLGQIWRAKRLMAYAKVIRVLKENYHIAMCKKAVKFVVAYIRF